MASVEFAEPHRHSARGCTSSSVLVASNGAQATITVRQQLDPTHAEEETDPEGIYEVER
jgi:hypothetical protein